MNKHLTEYADRRQWVNYIRVWDERKQGYDKPPINPHTLWDARHTDPATWATYDTAAANLGKTAQHNDRKHPDAYGNIPRIRARVEGVGVVLTGENNGINAALDFDHVIDASGTLAPWAAPILDRLDTYTEISPGGDGLHVLLCCPDLMESGRESFGPRFPLDASGNPTEEAQKAHDLEIYFYRAGGRYLTVTGKVYRDRPIRTDKSAVLLELLEEYRAKLEAWRASKAPSVRTHSYSTTGRATSAEDDRRMLDSALAAIDPSALDFNAWAAIMTAAKLKGYSLEEAERWSSGALGGYSNPKNDPRTNARRWSRFRFKRSDTDAGGVIINEAKRQGWTPAAAFDQDARTEYGRSLHADADRAAYGRSLYTDDQRREYGRQKHEERLQDWADRHAEEIAQWAKLRPMTDEEFEKWWNG